MIVTFPSWWEWLSPVRADILFHQVWTCHQQSGLPPCVSPNVIIWPFIFAVCHIIEATLCVTSSSLIIHQPTTNQSSTKYQTKDQPADDSTKVGVLPMTFCRGVPWTINILSSCQHQTMSCLIVSFFFLTHDFDHNLNNSFTLSSTLASYQP